MPFDPDAFIASRESNESNATPDAAAKIPFDPDTFISKSSITSTGEDAPSYADGLSPQTPLNYNPISMVDRFKIKALGNQKGSIAYLKRNYQDATVDKRGNILVKTDNLWHQVDPTGRGDGSANPWQRTKELISDMGDIAPELLTIGGTIGAGATTLGTGLLAGGAIAGAVKSMQTSLGRAVGTYDATPEEEVKDIAVETLLNMGGTVLAAGVKPTVGALTWGLKKSGETLAKIPEAARNITASSLGTSTNAGAVAIHELAANPGPVAGALKAAAATARGDAKVIDGNIVRSSTETVKNIVKAIPKALDDTYTSIRNELMNVGEKVGLTGTIDDAVGAGQKFVESNGLGKVINGKLEVTPYKTLIAERGLTGNVDPTAIVPTEEAHKAVLRLAKELNSWSGTKSLPGKEGIKQMLTFKKTVNDLTWTLKESAKDTPGVSASVPRFITDVHKAIEGRVTDSFSKVIGADGKPLYPALNSMWSKSQKDFRNFLKIARADDPKGYETLFKQIASSPSNHQGQKDALLMAVDLATQSGNKEIANQFKQIAINEAARGFVHIIKPGVANSLTTLGIGAAAASTMGIPAGLAAAAVATSPRATMHAVRAGVAAGKVVGQAVQPIQVLAKSMREAKQWLSSLPPEQLKTFVSSPQALQAFFTTINQTPALKQNVHDQLMGQAQQVQQQRQQFHQAIPQKGQKR